MRSLAGPGSPRPLFQPRWALRVEAWQNRSVLHLHWLWPWRELTVLGLVIVLAVSLRFAPSSDWGALRFWAGLGLGLCVLFAFSAWFSRRGQAFQRLREDLKNALNAD